MVIGIPLGEEDDCRAEGNRCGDRLQFGLAASRLRHDPTIRHDRTNGTCVGSRHDPTMLTKEVVMTALDQRTHEASDIATIVRDLDHRPGLLPSRRTPVALAVLLVIHGLAHFVGVLAAFGALEANEPLEYLDGAWTITSDLLIGLIGIVWACIGLSFVLAAVAVVTEFRGWERTLVVLGSLSFAMCVLALWTAWIGLIVNAVVIVVAVVSIGDRSRRPPRMAI